MRSIRSILFCSLALFASAFLCVAPSSASDLHRHDPGIYSLSLVSLDHAIPLAFHADAGHVAIVREDTVKPVKSRSIGILKPEYQASLATYGQSFIEVRLRC